MEKATALEKILDVGVIAIVRAPSAAGLLEAADAISSGGIQALEFTFTTPEARELIGRARERLSGEALVGAGTVLTAEDAHSALEAGAQFIVMPCLDRGAIEVAQRAGVPIMPGAFTPTEIVTAWQWGADLVKLFPASLGGPAYLQALRAPLPQIRLVPTGGVSAANAGEYIRAGAAAVAVGGKLVDRDAIAARNYGLLTRTARALVDAVQAARQEIKS